MAMTKVHVFASKRNAMIKNNNNYILLHPFNSDGKRCVVIKKS